MSHYKQDNQLNTQTHRTTLDRYIQATADIEKAAFSLFKDSYSWPHPLRSVTVGVGGLEEENTPCQLDMNDSADRDKKERLDRTIDNLRQRFGSACICRAISIEDTDLTDFGGKNKKFEG